MNRHSAVALLCLLAAGCQTFDQTLNTADRAIAAVKSPTARTVTDIARADSPEAVLREGLRRRAELYERDPQVLVNDLRTVRRDYDRLVAVLTGKVDKEWGKKETRLPSRTSYVKYTQNYQSRAVVDFDTGAITVETLDARDPRASLKNAIVTTLLTPDDPRAVDLYSDKSVTLTSDKPPYLLGLVQDDKGQSIATPAQAEGFADALLAKASTRKVEVKEGEKQALFVQFAMVANFQNKQAEKYRDVVAKYAAQYKVSPSLVFGVIRTESNFNPFAVSSAPAYGMMQLVPSSGGRDAYKAVKGRDEMPTREYLFDAENNIELGTAYLGLLLYKQLDMVANATSREYCAISAYNTGAGNVFRTFAGKDRVGAVNAINGMEPPAVYEKLRTSLPYEETRQYLVRVTTYRKQFLSFK
jgi:membrane-bound lytic murein transglycosylase C